METNRIQNLPNELRARADDSLFFTATALLGYNRLTHHLHYEMCRVMEMAEVHKRILMLVPRNHYKTTIATLSYPTWRAMRDPNETGLLVTNSATNANKWMGQIRKFWENKPLLRHCYPHLRPERSDRWNKDEACLPRSMDHPEATWSVAGWKTHVTSGHYDYLIFDDLVDEETYESLELMGKLTDRFEQRLTGLLRPPVHERVVIVVMNHWSSIDLACYILEHHPEFKVYYKQAIVDTPNGKEALFPEVWPLNRLLAYRDSHPFTFATQFMNNPSDPSLLENKIEWLQLYKRGEDSVILPKEYDNEEVPIGHLNIYAAADPRHSLSTTATQKLTSRNAVSVDGIDWKGRRYHLDEYAAKSAPEEFLRAMLAMHKKWHPIKFGIEAYGYQKALQPLAAAIWKNEEDKPYLELMPQDTKTSKTNKIRVGYRFFAEGKAFSHRFMVNFNEEFTTFDTGKFKDLGDCWAMNMHQMREPADESEDISEKEADRVYTRGLVGMGKI